MRMAAALAAMMCLSPAVAGDSPATAGGKDYHVAVTVPAGWQADTDRRPFPRVLVMSPQMAAFDRASAQPMKRQPDQIVCAFSRAVKKDPVEQTQGQINAAVRQNFEDLKAETRSSRQQDVLLFRLVEHAGLVGVAVAFVGTDARNFGYLYASSTFDTPLYQYKGDCIGELSEGSALKRDIVEIIGSFRPVP
jgi:hypothetical protein